MKDKNLDYKQELQDLSAKTVKKLYNLDLQVELTPTPKDFGSFYSTPVALTLAKKLKKDPKQIAENLQEELENKLPDWLSGVDISGVYINFHLDIKKVSVDLQNIKKPKLFSNKHKVIIEHTGVNPNKAMTVGHLRNAILGDSISKVYDFCGAKYEIQNYIDDTGTQVAHTVLALFALQKKWFGDEPKREKNQPLDEWYSTIYVWISQKLVDSKISDKVDLKAEAKKILYEMEKGRGGIADKAREVARDMLEAHLKTVQRLNIEYDVLVRESDLIDSGLWAETFEKLKKSPKIILEKKGQNSGCWVLKYGNEKEDKILVRADGSLVYTAKDIAYHFWKFGIITDLLKYKKTHKQPSGKELYTTSESGEKKSFGKGDQVINVIDISQTYPQKVVRDSFKILNYKKQYGNYYHLAYEQVVLSAKTVQQMDIKTQDDKSYYKMSGRAGIDVKANHLIHDTIQEINKRKDLRGNAKNIAIGAVRFYILSQRASQRLIFDIDKALATTGKSGVYCMYAYARSQGIIKKANTKVENIEEFTKLPESQEITNLIKTLSEFQNQICLTIDKSDPSFLVDYIYDLSVKFNNFYEKHPIIHEKNQDRKLEYLMLVKTFQTILKQLFELVGIPAEKAI
ncbi:arginine--tRNA ligase [Patescibacteria group bacterium]